MEFDLECGFAKARMTLGKEEEEKMEDDSGNETDEEWEEMMEEEEAKSRQIYDPEKKIFDQRKKRVTDLSENNRVTLPRPLGAENEAAIEMRRGIYMEIFREHTRKYCDLEGNQESNLTERQQIGVQRLRKRIKL